jgi:hypothetical protein
VKAFFPVRKRLSDSEEGDDVDDGLPKRFRREARIGDEQRVPDADVAGVGEGENKENCGASFIGQSMGVQGGGDLRGDWEC